MPVARQQTARGSAGGIMIRTTPGVPDSVDIMFFDERGADLSQAGQRKLDRVFARQEYRRAFPGEIGDLRFPASVFDSYTGALLREVDTTGVREAGLKVVVDAAHGSAGTGAAQPAGPARGRRAHRQPRSRRGPAHRDGRGAPGRAGAAGRDRGVGPGRLRRAVRPGRRADLAGGRARADRRGRPGAAGAARPGRRRAPQRPGGAAGDHDPDRRAGGRVPRHAGRVDDHLAGRPDPGRP